MAELEVAQSAASAFQQHDFLPVVGNVADILSRLSIVDHRPARHVDIHVLAVGPVTLVLTAIASVFSEDMALVLQVQQRPVVVVATQDDAATLATVATVRTSVGVILHMAQVHRAQLLSITDCQSHF